MDEDLFSEFPSSDRSIWEKQIAKEIKQPAAELANCHPLYPHSCKPYYSPEEFDLARFTELSSSQRKDTGWLNMPLVCLDDINNTANTTVSEFQAGAQAVLLNAKNSSIPDIEKFLGNTSLNQTPAFISSEDSPREIFAILSDKSQKLKGGIANDPLANWFRSGIDFDTDMEEIARVCELASSSDGFYPLMVESHVYQHAAMTPEQELAAMLAAFVFYLDKLTDKQLPAVTALKSIYFSFAIGTDYLSEIAKLRAFRMLYYRIANAYKCDTSLMSGPFIHTVNSSLYHAGAKPHTNIVRATNAAMSAVIGGCDALTILPFDNGSDLSASVALHISSLIAYESYIGCVADPSAGSYFIENRSLQIAESAWEGFLEIEKQGGIISSFESGSIQARANASWRAKVEAMHAGYVMVGVNKYNDILGNTTEHIEADLPEHDFLLTPRHLPSSWLRN
jgi:methylmalonyl-CoA mutase